MKFLWVLFIPSFACAELLCLANGKCTNGLLTEGSISQKYVGRASSKYFLNDFTSHALVSSAPSVTAVGLIDGLTPIINSVPTAPLDLSKPFDATGSMNYFQVGYQLSGYTLSTTEMVDFYWEYAGSTIYLGSDVVDLRCKDASLSYESGNCAVYEAVPGVRYMSLPVLSVPSGLGSGYLRVASNTKGNFVKSAVSVIGTPPLSNLTSLNNFDIQQVASQLPSGYVKLDIIVKNKSATYGTSSVYMEVSSDGAFTSNVVDRPGVMRFVIPPLSPSQQFSKSIYLMPWQLSCGSPLNFSAQLFSGTGYANPLAFSGDQSKSLNLNILNQDLKVWFVASPAMGDKLNATAVVSNDGGNCLSDVKLKVYSEALGNSRDVNTSSNRNILAKMTQKYDFTTTVGSNSLVKTYLDNNDEFNLNNNEIGKTFSANFQNINLGNFLSFEDWNGWVPPPTNTAFRTTTWASDQNYSLNLGNSSFEMFSQAVNALGQFTPGVRYAMAYDLSTDKPGGIPGDCYLGNLQWFVTGAGNYGMYIGQGELENPSNSDLTVLRSSNWSSGTTYTFSHRLSEEMKSSLASNGNILKLTYFKNSPVCNAFDPYGLKVDNIRFVPLGDLPNIDCSGIPNYVKNGPYIHDLDQRVAIVNINGPYKGQRMLFQCKKFTNGDWCNDINYAPGEYASAFSKQVNYFNAWTEIGVCNAN